MIPALGSFPVTPWPSWTKLDSVTGPEKAAPASEALASSADC